MMDIITIFVDTVQTDWHGFVSHCFCNGVSSITIGKIQTNFLFVKIILSKDCFSILFFPKPRGFSCGFFDFDTRRWLWLNTDGLIAVIQGLCQMNPLPDEELRLLRETRETSPYISWGFRVICSTIQLQDWIKGIQDQCIYDRKNRRIWAFLYLWEKK